VYKIYKFLIKFNDRNSFKKQHKRTQTSLNQNHIVAVCFRTSCGLVCVYQCFGGTYCLLLQGRSEPSQERGGLHRKVVEQVTENWRFKFNPKMKAKCSSKMLVMTYHTMQSHNLEDHNINLYRHGNHNQDNVLRISWLKNYFTLNLFAAILLLHI
jgi:hypothetical protein